MLSQKTLSKKFFTRTGDEIFRVVEVFEQVTLVNLESRLKMHIRLGTPEAREFVPVSMPVATETAEPKKPPTAKPKRGGYGKNAGWGSSKYRGVSFNKRSGKFLAVISRKGERWEGGMFETEELAAAAVAEYLGDLKEAVRTKQRPVPKKGAEGTPMTAGVTRTKKRGTSKYLGVSLSKNSGKWRAQLSMSGKYWYGGEFESEELAAAEVQEKLGNKKEAAELREMTRIKDQIADLTDPKLGKWMCHSCGAEYDQRPDQCAKCNSGIFEKV